MLFVLLAVFIFMIDKSIKKYIEDHLKQEEEKKIFHGKVLLTKHHNHGFMLNHFKGQTRLIRVVSSFVFALGCLAFILELFKKKSYLGKLSFSFLIGGAAGNLFDRIKKGYVTDYVRFLGRTPKKLQGIVFNLSDIFIFIGCVLVFIKEIFDDKKGLS